MKRFILLLLLASPVSANQVTPNFTQGSMQSTTTTTIDIDRTIESNGYGGKYQSWSGTNVKGQETSQTVANLFNHHCWGTPQLEIVDRAAGVNEDS